jgi:peroxiredoxin
MPKTRKPWLLILAAVAFGGLLLWFLTAPVPQGGDRVPEMAPVFSLPDLDGKTVSLADFRGKVVLLDFWATWCDPCLEELPDLIKLQDRFKDRGFTIVGVSADLQGAKVVGPFAKKHGINYPILISGGDIPEAYPVPGFPTAFLIDKQGKIYARYLGGQTVEDFSRDIEAALAK